MKAVRSYDLSGYNEEDIPKLINRAKIELQKDMIYTAAYSKELVAPKEYTPNIDRDNNILIAWCNYE